MKIKICGFINIDKNSLPKSKKERGEEIKLKMKHAKQRIERGWDDTVSWSIDYYLNENMPKWLTALKPVEGKIQGIPLEMFENEEYSEGAEMEARNKWSETLDTIIAGFEAAKQIEDKWVQESEDNELWKKFNLGMDNFKKYYFCLWD